jgi:PKHD-type hydroxylase
MLIAIPSVLTPEQVKQARAALDTADWVDGKATTGAQAARVKDNSQLPHDHPAAREVGQIIIQALSRNLLFMSAAVPFSILPPMFNRYAGGQHYGPHVDNAIRQVSGTSQRIRTDLSCTLFLAEPDEYDGGELVVEDLFGTQQVKLPAGHMVLYPSSSLHHVRPVTRGARVSSFFWVQSMIRDDAKRRILFDMDMAIVRLHQEIPDHQSVLSLTSAYHNLLRMWAEV